MPENESLSAWGRGGRRWQRLRERLDDGVLPIEIADDLDDDLCLCFQKVWKQWKACGVDPARLFEVAAGDQAEFDRLRDQIGGDDFAKILNVIAVCSPSATPQQLRQEFLEAVVEHVRDLIGIDRRPEADSPEFRSRVDVMLARMLHLLEKHPAKAPSRRRRPRSERDVDIQLKQSLI